MECGTHDFALGDVVARIAHKFWLKEDIRTQYNLCSLGIQIR